MVTTVRLAPDDMSGVTLQRPAPRHTQHASANETSPEPEIPFQLKPPNPGLRLLTLGDLAHTLLSVPSALLVGATATKATSRSEIASRI
jgi:hypothetical protein